MTDTFKTICLALCVGIVAGAFAATYVLEVLAQSPVRLVFYTEDGSRHLELGNLAAASHNRSVPGFWGLQFRDGDAITAIGIYTVRPAAGARDAVPALDNFGLPPHFEWPQKPNLRLPN